MEKRKQKASGLIGRCLLVGGLAFGNIDCGTRPNYMPLNIHREHIQFFTCNYWEDLEPYDGKADYPHEFSGIKNKFKKGERLELTLFAPISGLEGKKLMIVVYDKKGIPLAHASKIMANKEEVFHCGSKYNLMDALLEKGGPGEYYTVATLDGNYIGSHKFEITE